jgi:hypothetical protein
MRNLHFIPVITLAIFNFVSCNSSDKPDTTATKSDTSAVQESKMVIDDEPKEIDSTQIIETHKEEQKTTQTKK